MLAQSRLTPTATSQQTQQPAQAQSPGRGASSARGNAFTQESLLGGSAELLETAPTAAGAEEDWVAELLGSAPIPANGGGQWAGVIAQIRERAEEGEGQAAPSVSERGAADLDRLADAASRPWYSSPRGKCYRAVAGYDSSAYMNRAGGRWKALADRIPTAHAMWAVSFAHWLQETAHGRRAAAELGFTILESDGKTRLGDFLAARPELRGSIVVVPFGQEGTASQEWNAAAHYGAKWGKGVGDISVVTEVGARGATYVADGPVKHDNATMWWIVHPK